MNESSGNNFPAATLSSSGAGREFIGVAVLALPAAMNFFALRLLRTVVERDLKLAGVSFEPGWNYDEHRAIAILQTSDWRAAVGSVRNTLTALELLEVSGIWRYDFDENIWRRLHGTWTGDFKSITENISPEFHAAQTAKLNALLALAKKHLETGQEKSESAL